MIAAGQDAGRAFRKMHGLGNDFVIFDAREEPLALDAAVVRALADRRMGIGCDQLIVLRPSACADLFMEIRNADGGEVSACGNASRCVGRLVMDETGRETVRIETRAAVLEVMRAGDGVGVDMGRPGLDWRDIPLAAPANTRQLELDADGLGRPAAVSMGNPHMVFFVDDGVEVDLARVGPRLERHPLFPEGANVSMACVRDPGHIRLAVWERGAGLTRACGTAACAALVAAHRRGLAGREAAVDLPGGRLLIEWSADDHVRMTGPVACSFTGRVDLAAISGAWEAVA
ncbi:MAG: diaminopimelate epimerase [Rhodothalassiaceae bacterium]